MIELAARVKRHGIMIREDLSLAIRCLGQMPSDDAVQLVHRVTHLTTSVLGFGRIIVMRLGLLCFGVQANEKPEPGIM